MSDLKKLKEEFLSKLSRKLNLLEINQIKSELFGKNGLISSQFKKIGTIEVSERKKFAATAFNVSSHYDTAIFKYFSPNNTNVLKQSIRDKYQQR